MMTIKAHGIRNIDTEWGPLSKAQERLLTDPAPIRICGAPTGAGKTYAFIRVARKGAKVVFVVPTQALARDIQEEARRSETPSWLWDGQQSRLARESGNNVWLIRREEFDRFHKTGGILITTPETLQLACFGKKQQYDRIPIDLADFLTVDHIVFDEAHTLGVRAFGFLHFWAVLSVHWRQREPQSRQLKLTFLSATHSNLFEGFFDPDKDEDFLIPKNFISKFDETIENEKLENVRMLHGDVNISVDNENILKCVKKYAQSVLDKGERLLVLYDSLRQLALDEGELANFLCKQVGLDPKEVFMINGQDKNAGGRSTGGSGFEAGLIPENRHRVIIATSCLEAGVNIRDLGYAILDPGLDAASLLQRIGRVARGERNGTIWIASSKTKAQHTMKIEEIEGETTIQEIFEKLAPLRELPINRARRLGSAYWSMLKRNNKSIYEGLCNAHQETSPTPCPGKHLNRLWAKMQEMKKDKNTEKYKEWLLGIDDALLDLRGFSPGIFIQFEGTDAIEYSREWAEVYLDDPDDRYETEEGQEIWIYAKTRLDSMRETPKEKNISWALPNGVFIRNYPAGCPQKQITTDYAQKIVEEARYEVGAKSDFIKDVKNFVLSTGLFVRKEGGAKGVPNGIL